MPLLCVGLASCLLNKQWEAAISNTTLEMEVCTPIEEAFPGSAYPVQLSSKQPSVEWSRSRISGLRFVHGHLIGPWERLSKP